MISFQCFFSRADGTRLPHVFRQTGHCWSSPSERCQHSRRREGSQSDVASPSHLLHHISRWISFIYITLNYVTLGYAIHYHIRYTVLNIYIYHISYWIALYITSHQSVYFISYRIVSHQSKICHCRPNYIISYRILSHYIISYPFMSYHTLLYHVSTYQKNIPGSYIIKHQMIWFQYLKALRTFTPRKLPPKPPRNPVGSMVVSPAEISIFCTQGSVMKVESSVDCPAVKALGIFHEPPQNTSKIIQISHLKKDRWLATSNSHSVLEIANRTWKLHHLRQMVTSNAESAKGISSSHCFNGVTMKLIRQPQEVMLRWFFGTTDSPSKIADSKRLTAIGRLAINTLATWKSSHFSREIGKIPDINQRWFTYELQATLWLDDHGVASGEVGQRGRSGHSRAWWEVVLLLTQLSLGKRYQVQNASFQNLWHQKKNCLHHFVPRSLKIMPSCQKMFTSLHWQSHKISPAELFLKKISHTLTAPSAPEFPDVSGKTVGCKQPMRSWEINTSQKMPLSRQLQLRGLFFLERFDPKICNIMLCNHGVPDSFLDDSVVSFLKMFRSQRHPSHNSRTT